MQDNRLQSVHPHPASQERVQPRSHSLGRGRFLLWLLCYGLLLLGLSPGVALAGGEKVTLCHVPPGNPANAQTLVVAPSAVQAHLKNHAGDHLGPCTLPPECQTNSQCNDANPCTVDTCTTAGTCQHAAVSCNDGNVCTTDVCIPEQGGCVGVPAPGGACNDDNACTGTDTCNAEGKCGGTAIAGCCLTDADCNDSNACTADVCNTTTHTCSNTETKPTAAACHVYVCDQEIGWIDTDVTCVDDGNICTVEVCDPNQGTTGACVTQPNPTPPEGNKEVSCNDGLDNDCDGLIDSADPDCQPADPCTPNPCQNGGTCSTQTMFLCTCPAGYTGTYCETVVPPTCPCADNGDPIWNDATAMKAYWINNAYYSDWSCVKNTATLQATFMGMHDYCYDTGSSPIPPTVVNGVCQGSYGDITVNSTQAQACIQKMEALGAQSDPPVTCVEQGGGGGGPMD